MVRDFFMDNNQVKEGTQEQASGVVLRRTASIYALKNRVIKRVLLMLLPVCCKYFQLMIMHL